MKRLAVVLALTAAAYLFPAGTAADEPAVARPLPDSAFATLGPLEDVVPVPLPSPTSHAAPVSYVLGTEGLASWMPARYGRDYAALPAGPGWRFRVCGAGGCWEAVSNDAGPDLAMQRAGRVIDLAVGRWEQVTGVDRRLGLAPVTVTILGRTR